MMVVMAVGGVVLLQFQGEEKEEWEE